jgi:hypothetical protein
VTILVRSSAASAALSVSWYSSISFIVLEQESLMARNAAAFSESVPATSVTLVKSRPLSVLA